MAGEKLDEIIIDLPMLPLQPFPDAKEQQSSPIAIAIYLYWRWMPFCKYTLCNAQN